MPVPFCEHRTSHWILPAGPPVLLALHSASPGRLIGWDIRKGPDYVDAVIALRGVFLGRGLHTPIEYVLEGLFDLALLDDHFCKGEREVNGQRPLVARCGHGIADQAFQAGLIEVDYSPLEREAEGSGMS